MQSKGQIVDVREIELTAEDDTKPSIVYDSSAGRNIASEAGRWVRGVWNASFTGEAQDGICRAFLAVDGAFAAGERTAQTPDTGSWTQCGTGAGRLGGSGSEFVPAKLDTTSLPNGTASVIFYAADAAQPANVDSQAVGIAIDNSPVSVTLSTPANPDDGQPQTIAASAAAGPSGVAGITCVIDGSRPQTYLGAHATLTVSRPGPNSISCDAMNGAVNAEGYPAVSPVANETVDIRQPTVGLISMTKVADAMHCRRRTERLRVPGRWVYERYRGHRVHVWIPPQRRIIRVLKCHPRIRVRHIWRDGHRVTERTVVLPRDVQQARERIRFGARATVDGWLGQADGVAAGGQPVLVLSAPTNGGPFSVVAHATTAANGTWSARLPAGPSRVVRLAYGGSALLAPMISSPATVVVPAKVQAHVAPHQTHWGSTIKIFGRLRGGYIPRSGELVVLWIGWAGGATEIGHVYTDQRGRFATRYTFLRGRGAETYRIWAQTARESDYPYAPARSGKTPIRVSG